MAPEDIPPPTPVHLPQCRPRPVSADSAGPEAVSADTSSPQLTTLLQSLVRPPDQVQITHLELLGVLVNPDVSLLDLVPDASCLPDFNKWDSLSREEALALDIGPRPELCNKKAAPGAAKYVDIRLGLLIDNGRAFRSVNRVSPQPGEPVVRLGYCHEFFKDLECVTGFWDDTSVTRPSIPTDKKPPANGDELAEKSPTRAMELCNHASGDNDEATKEFKQAEMHDYYRTMAGTSMPPQYRTKLLTSFLKLVTYDFSCNIMSRAGPEPRLYIKSPTSSSSTAPPKHSYFSSGCNFLFRTPGDRDSVKRGVIDGPIAAVSPRHTTLFPPRGKEREAVIDLSREVIAALIAAQNRSRQGKVEERIGKDTWWATKRRWGGGPGGPVGKEEDLVELNDVPLPVVGDKEEKVNTNNTVDEGEGELATKVSPSRTTAVPAVGAPGCRTRGRTSSSGSSSESSTQPRNPKRPRTHLALYDAYRMVRPPTIHWDSRTNYTAIGRQRSVDYDDVFVISVLFHHISILRVRVPDRLLEVLSGAIADPGVNNRGKVEVWRTRWFDFFIAQDRVDAMKALWAVMAYSMRRTEPEEEKTSSEATKDDGAKKDSPRR